MNHKHIPEASAITSILMVVFAYYIEVMQGVAVTCAGIVGVIGAYMKVRQFLKYGWDVKKSD